MGIRARSRVAFILLGLLAASARAGEPRACLVDGTTLTARIVTLDSHAQATLQTDAARQQFPIQDLVEWGAPVEPAQKPLVVLSDGAWLVADSLHVDERHLVIESGVLGRVRLARDTVAGLVLQSPADRLQRDRLVDQVGLARPDGPDELRLANGDRMTGRLGALASQSVRWEADGVPAEVARDRVAAVALRGRSQPAGGFRIWVGLRDGTRLPAESLEVAGQDLRLAWQGRSLGCRADDLVWLQPRGARAVYLSDLAADDYRHVPYLTLSRRYVLDRSLDGAQLRCGGRLYAKGLGMPSMSRLTYRLPQGVRRFEAGLGVDDETESRGSVRFRVFVDGQLQYTSPTVRGGDAPVPLLVEVAGAERLDLVVDFAERADVLDHADWLNARLVP